MAENIFWLQIWISILMLIVHICDDMYECLGVGVREGFAHQYPHMLVTGYDSQWTVSQCNAMALLFCFGHALGLAKRLYGVNFYSFISFLLFNCDSAM